VGEQAREEQKVRQGGLVATQALMKIKSQLAAQDHTKTKLQQGELAHGNAKLLQDDGVANVERLRWL